MQSDVLVYSHEWHLTQSDAFLDLVVRPLESYAKVSHQVWSEDQSSDLSPEQIAIFCQILPSTEWLAKQKAKLIWVPMWDEVRERPQTWWNQIPKSLRVVAFSKAVALRARAAGLLIFEAQYFKNPAEFTPANWADKRTLFYWNRRGIINPAFLERFCAALKIERLLFRPDIDPYVDARAYYTLPAHIGNTFIETLAPTSTREAYWKLIEPANIVIAPRLHEGAGMVFLEQMARGCAVFANNAPTMNEYIQHESSGFLFRRGWTPTRARNAVVWRLARTSLGQRLGLDAPFSFLLPEQHQDWNQIAALDLQTIGDRARRQHFEGYQRWKVSISDYAHFILDG